MMSKNCIIWTGSEYISQYISVYFNQKSVSLVTIKLLDELSWSLLANKGNV